MPADLLIVDLEATCWERHEHRPEEMETIEIGALRIEPGAGPRVREFQIFVRPRRHPLLSDFCRGLTSIRQADVDGAEPFPEAFGRFVEWIGEPRDVLFASWGDYDKRQFQRDCARHGVAYPFEGHWNLKRVLPKGPGRRTGMEQILAGLGLAQEGTPHRGLDDAKNIWRIVEAVLGEGLGSRLEAEVARVRAEAPNSKRLARFLSLVLRHRSADFGLAADEEGFVSLESLVGAVERHASPRARRADVLAVLERRGQARFERRGDRVRAVGGPAGIPQSPRARRGTPSSGAPE